LRWSAIRDRRAPRLGLLIDSTFFIGAEKKGLTPMQLVAEIIDRWGDLEIALSVMTAGELRSGLEGARVGLNDPMAPQSSLGTGGKPASRSCASTSWVRTRGVAETPKAPRGAFSGSL
jgi:hypothetical protein